MKKVIFMDVDGTLVNDHSVVPESAKLAIRKAREITRVAEYTQKL